MGRMINQPIGFLSPAGEFIDCGYMEHLEIARNICKKHNYTYIESPTDCLIAHGWVQTTMMKFLDFKYLVLWEKALTQEQINFLKPIFDAPENELYIPIDTMTRDFFEDEIKI